jgi:DNA-binding beta-propeller fold protein YncE
MRTFLVSGAAFAAACTLVGAGFGAGPAPGVLIQGAGVSSPDGKTRYMASTKGTSTLVRSIRVSNGAVMRSTTLKGVYGVPLITFGGLTGGLTTDGRTLVLASQPYVKNGLAKRSRFAVFSTSTLRVRALISLSGLFSFDALSPDGNTLYLIEHFTSDSGQFRYRVRAYDLVTHELVRHVVADPQTWADSMVGFPMSRATGPGGAWVYTLYTNGSAPFVHALDAANRKAVCVDLPWKGTAEAFGSMQLSLSADASQLFVRPEGSSTPAFVIDTKTLRVVTP